MSDAGENLSVDPRSLRRLRPGRARSAGGRPRLVRHRARARRVALVGESGSGKSVTALSVMKLLPYPAAHHPSGSIVFKGRELLTMPENEIRRRARQRHHHHLPGADDVAQSAAHDREADRARSCCCISGMTGEAARARIIELLDQVGIPDPAGAARQLSASALRRPAPARDDRDGACQRAGPADRRRADHRARRHRAGADPQAAEGHCRSGSAWRCCSSPTTSASCARSPTASA